jgi:hypothetical protein
MGVAERKVCTIGTVAGTTECKSLNATGRDLISPWMKVFVGG